MQPVQPSPATPHSSHDLLLLAAATDRDADPTLRAAAAAQAARCPQCAALAEELRAVADGLAALPAARPAPRDMRLSPEDAARLGRGRLWRRLLRPFGADGLPGLRPLAATLTTLGLAGILLTAIPFGLGGAASLAPFDTGGRNSESSTGAPAPAALASAGSEDQQPGMKGSIVAPIGSSSASAGVPGYGTVDLASPHGQQTANPNGQPSFAAQGSGPRLPPLAWVSLALVVAGLGLFSVLLIARRVA